jgi:hypothetical protein
MSTVKDGDLIWYTKGDRKYVYAYAYNMVLIARASHNEFKHIGAFKIKQLQGPPY